MSNLHSAESVDFEKKIESLEVSVSKLVEYCEKLAEENKAIKHTNSQLMLERSELQSRGAVSSFNS